MPVLAELPPTLVIDASVGLKWVVGEPGTEIAVALIAGRRLLVPDLFWIETANALVAKVRRSELTRAESRDAWLDLSPAPVSAVATGMDALTSAMALAQDLGHSLYDCLYLGLALIEKCPVVTADRRFADIVRGQSSLLDRIILLDELTLR